MGQGAYEGVVDSETTRALIIDVLNKGLTAPERVSAGVPASGAVRRPGQDKPVAENDTEGGRAQNRRIEFTVVN